MLPQTTVNQPMYNRVRDLLQNIYVDQGIKQSFIKTLAMMITGMLLGPHIQLFAIAMCVPLFIKLPSIVRRFERFVADGRVKPEKLYEPFVLAMVSSWGNETAYLIIDCTQAGPKCRTLFIGLAYHSTVLPIVWKTVKGKKGHVTADLHKELIENLYPKFRHCQRVIVLGDAEFGNGPLIKSLKSKNWGFVFSFQSDFLLQTEADGPWRSVQTICETAGIKPGQVKHWQKVSFTRLHQIPNLTLTIHWDEKEEKPLFLISNLPPSEQPHLIYDKRFWIETLFGNCKSRGFQLARTLMTTPTHIDRLILALSIATCLILGLGTHLIVTEQSDQVDRADRRDLSLFQIGWRWLYRLLAFNRLDNLKILFRWDFKLPKPGFQPVK
ncbi:MAG: transposase [Cytophagales bacterium]|nr:transposase [Cytophagales bacterium]